MHDNICASQNGCKCNCPAAAFMESEKNRLMRFALRFDDGNWHPNGEDCIPALEELESEGLIERNGENRWRLNICRR